MATGVRLFLLDDDFVTKNVSFFNILRKNTSFCKCIMPKDTNVFFKIKHKLYYKGICSGYTGITA